MKSTKLSRRQQDILDAIRDSVLTRGYPPSIRELCVTVDLSSSSTVHSHLRALEAKGYLRRTPSKPRSLQLVEAPGTMSVQERLARLEALVREAQRFASGPAALAATEPTPYNVDAVAWMERAATVLPVPA